MELFSIDISLILSNLTSISKARSKTPMLTPCLLPSKQNYQNPFPLLDFVRPNHIQTCCSLRKSWCLSHFYRYYSSFRFKLTQIIRHLTSIILKCIEHSLILTQERAKRLVAWDIIRFLVDGFLIGGGMLVERVWKVEDVGLLGGHGVKVAVVGALLRVWRIWRRV